MHNFHFDISIPLVPYSSSLTPRPLSLIPRPSSLIQFVLPPLGRAGVGLRGFS